MRRKGCETQRRGGPTRGGAEAATHRQEVQRQSTQLRVRRGIGGREGKWRRGRRDPQRRVRRDID
eukprot:3384694-Rhodomonas_salina.1